LPAGAVESDMKTALIQIFKRAFRAEPKLHPIEGRLAKRWIKQRLLAVFPELRNNPAALEAAYQALNMEPRDGAEEGGSGTVFHLTIPGER
jgi:hypothetical protein